MSEQPAEQPAAGGDDPLAGLDFALLCDMAHDDQPCERPAAYTAKFHKCGKGRDVPGGQDMLVCEYMVKRAIERVFPYRCEECHHYFGRFDELIWDIQPLGRRS